MKRITKSRRTNAPGLNHTFGTPVTPKNLGPGAGFGHGGNTPNLPVIRPVERTAFIQNGIDKGHLELDVQLYKMGKCSIMVGTDQGKVWHMSIAHPDRYPTWDEVAKARYELLPENVTVAMLMPPKADYINYHNFCFQLWQVFPTTEQGLYRDVLTVAESED